MELHEAFVVYLKAQTGLTALIGQGLYPDFIPEGVDAPGVVYQLIGGEVEDTHDGAGIDGYDYQFSTYDKSNKKAWAIFIALKNALRNYKGLMGTLNIQRVQQISMPIKDYENDTKYHSYKVDFRFYYDQ